MVGPELYAPIPVSTAASSIKYTRILRTGVTTCWPYEPPENVGTPEKGKYWSLESATAARGNWWMVEDEVVGKEECCR